MEKEPVVANTKEYFHLDKENIELQKENKCAFKINSN